MGNSGRSQATGAVALGALVYDLAVKAGYDLSPRGNGRKRLANDTGMSVWAVGRMLRGETLPKVENVYALASALGAKERLLLDAAGYRQRAPRPIKADRPVLSVATLTPEAIADALGITHPFVRKMLTSSINEAIRLQREADEDEDGEIGDKAVAR